MHRKKGLRMQALFYSEAAPQSIRRIGLIRRFSGDATRTGWQPGGSDRQAAMGRLRRM